MPLLPFKQIMADAEDGGYAVGYFESWNLESLQAVIEVAEELRSPVIVGFSGMHIPDARRAVDERLELYAAMGLAACQTSTVATSLIFNECPHFEWLEKAVALGFNVVMFADETLTTQELWRRVRETVAMAQGRAAVEGEVDALPGVAEGLATEPASVPLTDPEEAARFVEVTGVDALAVSLGQAHLHGRAKLGLALDRLAAILRRVEVPLVLHGATSVDDNAIRAGVELGIRKINVGSALRRAFFDGMNRKVVEIGEDYNPYEVLGSGLKNDLMLAGKIAMKSVVKEKILLFGSASQE